MKRLVWLAPPALATLSALLQLSSAAAASAQGIEARPAGAPAHACAQDQTGLRLPAGFCASIFADDIGHARHLAVAPNGVVYVNTWSGDYYPKGSTHAGGFLVALQDTHGSGVADVVQRFGETLQTGGHGGTGIALYHGHLYAEINDRIVRYALESGSIVPHGKPEVVVSGLPLGGDHPMHPFAIDADGSLYIDVATATNSCQIKNREFKSPGIEPCIELQTRGGVWRYDAGKLNQKFSPAERYATGLRNAEGIAIDTVGGGLLVTQHGRDQLRNNWPTLYQPEEEATLPAEELLHAQRGGDFGWPECYYDSGRRKLVLAPEYGGDGGKSVGVCAQKSGPMVDYPAHWAPDDLLRYGSDKFPARYRDGVFIAFHGSWDRAPYAQGGYNVVFQPLSGDQAAGRCEIFADGFAGPSRDPEHAKQRPAGLATGPDGALYVADDVHGRIYRIVFEGGIGSGAGGASNGSPCPDSDAPAGPKVAAQARPPEGTHPNAGAVANAPVPPGATRALVELGEQVFSGQVGDAGCTGCHGSDAGGTPQGPKLTAHKWLWSDGSYAGIQRTVSQGVPNPKQYRSPMPVMGGAQLSDEQVAAVAAYIWSISHTGGARSSAQ